MSFTHAILLILAVSAVAIADVLLREAQPLGSLSKALTSPWVLGAIVLYLFQIIIFTYLFVSGEHLLNVGLVQVALYEFIVVIAAVMLFKETLTTMEAIGALFAVIGIVLLNL